MGTAGFMSNRVSRWTLAYFALGLVNFVSAQVLMAAGGAYPARPLFAPETFAAVHLITLGWLTLLMFGALLQFVPVISSRPLPSQKLALAALVLLEAGLLAMVAGFYAIGAGAAQFAHCLPAGGALFTLGALLAAGDVALPLLRAQPLSLPGRFVLAGLAFLCATLALGLLLALALTVPATGKALAPLIAGVGLHALLGIGGWFTLTAIGVSYKLLPMFMLAPEERGGRGEAVFYLCVFGLTTAVSAGVVKLYVPAAALSLISRLGLAAAATGTVIYVADVMLIYRTRSREAVELHNRAAVWAYAALAAAVVIATALIAADALYAYGGVLGFVVLFGWLGGLGLTQLYKIVPFLTWLGRYGSSLGRGPVPRVQDLVDERRAAPWFSIYFVAVVAGAIAGFAGVELAWRGALAVSSLATLVLAREYWRAWRGVYASRPNAVAPLPAGFLQGRS